MTAFADFRPGGFVLTGKKSAGIISRAIRLGQTLRRYPKEARVWSHCYLVLEAGPDPLMIEASKRGVRTMHASHLTEGDWLYVETNVDSRDMAQVGIFCDAVLEAKWRYGFETFFGLAIYCLTGAQVTIQKAGTAICSGLICDALTRAGYVFPRPPYAMLPADLYVMFVK